MLRSATRFERDGFTSNRSADSIRDREPQLSSKSGYMAAIHFVASDHRVLGNAGASIYGGPEGSTGEPEGSLRDPP